MFCSNCGVNLNDNVNFCSSCGNKVNISTTFDSSNKNHTGSSSSSHAINHYEALSFGEAFSSFLSKAFVFEGRASRSEYWWGVFFAFLITIPIEIIIKFSSSIFLNFLLIIPSLYLSLAQIACASRRLHDTNKSGWRQLWSFTIIGLIPVLVWLCTSSDKNKNLYGDVPLKKLDDNFENNEVNYGIYTPSYLILNNLYAVKEYKGSQYYLLKSGNSALKTGAVVKVFYTEDELKKFLNGSNVTVKATYSTSELNI
jgi:uncharacterized membrane protein YhaH (DUF805 family)